jgi:hypothetical protein
LLPRKYRGRDIEDDDEDSLRIELAGRTGDTDSKAEGVGVDAGGMAMEEDM